MIKSMTGYGRARETRNSRDITVEVRAVNNRYLDCTVKMPRLYIFAEDALKQRVQRAVSRGKVDVFVSVDASAADVTKVSVNRELAGQYAAALEELFAKLDCLRSGDVLVLAGSIPVSLPDDIYQRILARLADREILTAVDATRDLLRAVLPYRPFLIKPNRSELGELFGRTPADDQEIEDCARRLQEEGARNVLVSMAGDGSLLLDETGGVHRLGVPKGAVRNSVGAGDSMVAGFLAGWLEHGDYALAHRLGTAAGAATAFSEGLAARDQVLALMETF